VGRLSVLTLDTHRPQAMCHQHFVHRIKAVRNAPKREHVTLPCQLVRFTRVMSDTTYTLSRGHLMTRQEVSHTREAGGFARPLF
jgi:hypothetical protein